LHFANDDVMIVTGAGEAVAIQLGHVRS
jgi:hypothetical protein